VTVKANRVKCAGVAGSKSGLRQFEPRDAQRPLEIRGLSAVHKNVNIFVAGKGRFKTAVALPMAIGNPCRIQFAEKLADYGFLILTFAVEAQGPWH
jgi:hypothetical protein